MRRVLLAVLFASPLAAPAETVFKCLDDRKRVTYSNVACAKQGLKDAGTVEDRTMTMPLPAQKPPPVAAPVPAPPKDPDSAGSGTQVKPASPVIEKLIK